jgi:hypothetical protein
MQKLYRIASGWKLSTDVAVEVLREPIAQSQDHGDKEFDGRCQSDPLRENVIICPFDPEEQQVVDIPHCARHREERLVVLREVLLGFPIEVVRAFALKLHQGAETIVIH